MKEVLLHYIVLEDGVMLSKIEYAGWREIQDNFEKYVTSLGPWGVDELIDYLQSDFGPEKGWPFSKKAIHSFVVSEDLEFLSSC